MPLEKSLIQTIYLQNVLSFLNIVLAGFVLVAIVVRFAFPAVSEYKSATSIPLQFHQSVGVGR